MSSTESDTESFADHEEEPTAVEDLADFVGQLAPAEEPSEGAAPEAEHPEPEPVKKAKPETKASIMVRVDRLRQAVQACSPQHIDQLPRECRGVAAQLACSRHALNQLKRDALAAIDADATACRLREALAMAQLGPVADSPAAVSAPAEPEYSGPAKTVLPTRAKPEPRRVARRGGEPVDEQGLTASQRAAIFATQTTLILAQGVEDASAHLPGDWCLSGFASRLGEPSSRSQLATTLEEMIRTAEPGSIFHPSSFSPEVKLAVILLAAAAPSISKKPTASGPPQTSQN
jgi:DNA-binding FrmR family transcriptional regulator